jgi:L-alanine-DL-glutamate epimerase-like enolase superfamily enzyme
LFFCLLATPLASAGGSGNAAVNAVQLLTKFSGENAQQYASFFSFSAQTRIVTVEIHAVGTHDTTARYSSHENPWHEVNNILRIKTANGLEGISGVDAYYEPGFSNELLLELQGVSAELLALKTLDPVEVGRQLAKTRPDLSDAARSSIDIAMWDLAARRADRPLYQLLGAKRGSIECYASLPFYESHAQYLAAVDQYAALGYQTFKFHVWGRLKEDLQLVELVQQTYADNTPYQFMIDAESAYDFEHALRLGSQMDQGLFIWLEAPIKDELLEQYQNLRNRLGQSIIPSGYTLYSPEFIGQGIQFGAWDAGRFDATVVGGITRALELLMIADAAGLPIEIQSWGHTLSQATNLHLMLANDQTRYFEAAMPAQPYEFGMKNGIVLQRGRVLAPEAPGLGIEVDWNRLDSADFYTKYFAYEGLDEPQG